MMKYFLMKAAFVTSLLALTLVANGPAHADLTLTAAGIADGFGLTNFASGGPGGTYTYLAAAALPDGTLVTLDYQTGLDKYADVDGQTPGSKLASAPASFLVNLADAGGKTYASALGGGLYQVSNSLGLTPVSVPGFTAGYGLAANPVNGDLLVAGSGSGLYDVNPLTGTFTAIAGANGIFIDGVSVSPDGKTVYGAAAQFDQVRGYDIATGAQVFSFQGTSPDGTGVISGGKYNGYVIANNNDGTVTLIDPTGATGVVIASGGSRGDFTSPDLNNGTLLLASYGEMFRLTAPEGKFGGSVPEPSTFALLGLGGLGMAIAAIRRRRAAV